MAGVPATTEAARKLGPSDFYSKDAPKLDPLMVVEFARKHDIEPEVLFAFADVESPKGSYMPDGRPYILFEAHVFSRNCKPKGKFDNDHPTLSSPKWNSRLYGAGGAHQYDRLQRAMKLDQRAALMACSWGQYQILAENYGMLGFATVEDCVLRMVESEAGQFECFTRFVIKKGIISALQQKDWETAAYKYNGPAHAEHDYAGRIARRYRELTAHILILGATGPKVATLQRMLNLHGYSLEVNSIFDRPTEAAVKDFQRRNGLTVDGKVGAQTYSTLAAKRVATPSLVTSKRVAGGAAAVATGAGVVVETQKVAESVKQVQEATDLLATMQKVNEIGTQTNAVIATAKQTTEQVKSVANYLHTSMLLLGLLVIALGAYIIWTKWYDNKKSRGVSGEPDKPTGGVPVLIVGEEATT